MSIKRCFTVIQGFLFSGFFSISLIASKLRWSYLHFDFVLIVAVHIIFIERYQIHSMSLRANKLMNIRSESKSDMSYVETQA